MANPSLFSVPAAVVLNHRLISQRGGTIPEVSHSAEVLRFKLFINSNPSSVRYGLTLQITALRDMSKEHNFDLIPEHPTYIFFPTHSFFHYRAMTPSRGGAPLDLSEGVNIDEKEAVEITRSLKMFRVQGEADFSNYRHMMLKCNSAIIDLNKIPKLRSECLEWELKRIFGTIKTANELENACLELDCLLPAMRGQTDRALDVLHDAAVEGMLVRGVEELTVETNRPTGVGYEHKESGNIKSERLKASPLNTNLAWKGERLAAEANMLTNIPCEHGVHKKQVKPNASPMNSELLQINSGPARLEIDCQENLTTELKNKDSTPKKPFIPAIIDGHFVSPNKTPVYQNAKNTPMNKGEDVTCEISPTKYLHPHIFDSENSKQGRENGSDKEKSPGTTSNGSRHPFIPPLFDFTNLSDFAEIDSQ